MIARNIIEQIISLEISGSFLAIVICEIAHSRLITRRLSVCPHLNIFQNFRRAIHFFSLSFSLVSLSFYILSIRTIYFSVADLDRMSRMFSLVLSPKFYRGRTSIVISLFGIHFPILPPVSRSVTLFPLPLAPLFYLSFFFALFLPHAVSISGSVSRIGRIRRILVQFRIVGLYGSK